MKKTAISATLLAVSINAIAHENYSIGLGYGAFSSSNIAGVTYDEPKASVILTGGTHHIESDIIIHQAGIAATLKAKKTIGNFTYALGIGHQKVTGTLVDNSQNWKVKSVEISDSSFYPVAEIKHKSGAFLQYSRHNFNDGYTFSRYTTPPHCKFACSKRRKLISNHREVDETIDQVLIGYQVSF